MDCLEYLWTRVGCESIGEVLLLGPDRGSSLVRSSPFLRWRWGSFILSGWWWMRAGEVSVTVRSLYANLLWRSWLWVLNCWDYMHEISSLFITICLECRGVTCLQCGRGEVAFCRRRSQRSLLGTSEMKSEILDYMRLWRVMSSEQEVAPGRLWVVELEAWLRYNLKWFRELWMSSEGSNVTEALGWIRWCGSFKRGTWLLRYVLVS